MRYTMAIFISSFLLLILSGCGDNKGKVEKGGEVPVDPNVKLSKLKTPDMGAPAPAAKSGGLAPSAKPGKSK
ncbi:MAG: hypothetical protein JNJ77_01560 [Planctomycetia bacterium]|nr:hypothetical protein [Planctomycetia bacterium]